MEARKLLGWSSSFVFAALSLSACSEGGSSTSPVQAPREPFAFPARSFIGEGFPGQLVSGDLDRDGVADVAVPLTNSTLGAVVALSYLDRRGRPKRTVELGEAVSPGEVVLSDCNGDGRSDVLVLDLSIEAVLVYLQEGDRSFGAPLPFAVGDRPVRLIAARLDADSAVDVLTVNQAGHTLCVLRGRGDGTFEPAMFPDPIVAGALDAVAGDLNQDGALDLALLDTSGCLLLLGSGDGRFGTPQRISVGFNEVALRLGDLTGDGSPDIVLSSCNGLGLRILEGDGAGSFLPGFTLTGCFSGIEMGDLDGDDIVDLVLVGDDGITPLLGLGGGDFVPGPAFSPGAGSQADFALWDADHDLDLDLVSVGAVNEDFLQTTTDLALLAGKGDGAFEGPSQYEVGLESRALVVGDFLRDGVPDLAVLRNPSVISVLGGRGDGSFLPRIETPLAAVGHVLAGADVDGNTLEDLLVANTNFAADELVMLSSTGAGTFDPPFTIPCGGFSPRAVRVADLDSDLWPDLVVCNASSNQIAVHLGMPGGFSKPQLYGVGALPRDLELSDLDGDGILDAVVANQDDDSASVLLGNGDGTFLAAVAVPAFVEPQELEVGDFDDDGLDDLAVLCDDSGDSDVLLLSGQGDGTFIPRQTVPDVPRFTTRLLAADLNRDGQLDLITATSSVVFLQIANGSASYEPRSSFLTNAGVGGVEVQDLDADGKPDLVVAAGSRAQVFLNRGP